MDWLNYHHLRYFWTVAKEGSLKKAAEKLNVSPPSISAQIAGLEESLDAELFRKVGRSKVLTAAGRIALQYADEIFAAGTEMVNAIKQRPTAHAMRLYVGVADSLPKLVTHEILEPVFKMKQPVRIICREGKIEDLLAQLATHRLDIVLADEPAPSTTSVRTYNHLLGESGVSFCATPALALKLRKGFPRSLDQAPMLLPVENTSLRRSLEQWFLSLKVEPNVLAEFEDVALMKVMAAEGKAVIPIPTVVLKEAALRFGLKHIGSTD
ncbi:MAG: transcriptional regulator, LysR family, partial [Verrucomicrobiaceae bacterium]|nr:transcriptional regulator, LysR family [Verrucomicrobiaceae bacterium]